MEQMDTNMLTQIGVKLFYKWPKVIGIWNIWPGIEGVYSEASTWRLSAKNNEGAQIDLLIDRQDRCINLCEIKFSIGEFVISKSYASELEKKLDVFRARTQTNKTLFLTMITTFGVKDSENKTRVVQSEIRMNALFER